MATLDDVGLMAAELPEVTEGERHGNRTWFVGGKAFAWDRPFSRADIRRFGDQTPPDGPILAVRVEDLGEKEAVLAANPDAFFTIPHFDGYSAVLIQLPRVSARALRDAITDGWLACAPSALGPAPRAVGSRTGRVSRPRPPRGISRPFRCIRRVVRRSDSARAPSPIGAGWGVPALPDGRDVLRPAGSSEYGGMGVSRWMPA